MTTTSPKTTKSTKTGSSQEDPVDMTTSDSNVNIGDKRKATTDSTSDSILATKKDEEEQGKDLVEKKQTTLDDIVHSEKDHQKSATGDSESKSEERPAKKTKTEESSVEVKDKDKDEVKEREEKVKEREEKVKEKEEKVDKDIEMKSSPSKSKSTSVTDKPTRSTSTSNPEPESKPEKTTIDTDTQAPKSDQTPVTNDTTKDNGENGETVPGDEAHLDHPENWTTGGDPATEKQKGFLKVLEKQKGVPVGDLGGIGKSEASEKIDELKNMCEYSHHLERS
jgi:hypothetical protein